jgi:hypothetical protein
MVTETCTSAGLGRHRGAIALRVPLTCAVLLQSSVCTAVEYVPKETPSVERELKLPPFPRAQNMIQFDPGLRNSNRYYVDPQSIAVGEDGVVRYTMMVKSASGAENISYEGIRCRTLEHKYYAFGRKDGTWGNMLDGPWRQVDNRNASLQLTLWTDYFCVERSRWGSSPKKAIDRFKNGSPVREPRER